MSNADFESREGEDTDLSLDDLAEIQDLLTDDPNADRQITPGECLMARDMEAAGDSRAEIATRFPVDQRALTPHLLGLCDCQTGGEQR